MYVSERTVIPDDNKSIGCERSSIALLTYLHTVQRVLSKRQNAFRQRHLGAKHNKNAIPAAEVIFILVVCMMSDLMVLEAIKG